LLTNASPFYPPLSELNSPSIGLALSIFLLIGRYTKNSHIPKKQPHSQTLEIFKIIQKAILIAALKNRSRTTTSPTPSQIGLWMRRWAEVCDDVHKRRPAMLPCVPAQRASVSAVQFETVSLYAV
jgi:hypothetical protein